MKPSSSFRILSLFLAGTQRAAPLTKPAKLANVSFLLIGKTAKGRLEPVGDAARNAQERLSA
jgi:hypothetical protein